MPRIVTGKYIVTWGKRGGNWFVFVEDEATGWVLKDICHSRLTAGKVIDMVIKFGIDPVYVAHTVAQWEQ